MIYIFHGENQQQSRQELNKAIEKLNSTNFLRLDKKEIELEKINNFLNTTSFFENPKILVLSNFFSIHKSTLDKISHILKNCQEHIFIWQNKKLTPAQLKNFPHSQVSYFTASKTLFACVYSIKANNLKQFISLYRQTIKNEPFELLLYFIKNNLRKQLQTYSSLDQNKLKKAYLYLIELDYKNKTGRLSISEEIALERVIINLLQ